MKIRLTEGQYKRLLTEDKKGRFNTVTPKVLRLMELIYNYIGNNASKDEITKFLIKDMGLTTNESLTIYNSWIMDFRGLDGDGYKDLLGKELEFKGVYSIKLDFPVYLCGRTHIPGHISVEASSEEEALNNIQIGDYIDMEIDENSEAYINPKIDINDIDVMEDMVVDHMSDYNIDELEDNIMLK
jgi:hypothetical protein